MSAATLLADLDRAGVRVEAVGDRLHWQGPITPELRQELAVHKAAILALLAPANDAADRLRPPVETCAPVPLVRCGQCRHYEQDAINPPQGLGRCKLGAQGNRLPWPNAIRRCRSWYPTPGALLAICRTACEGLPLDHVALARLLEKTGDPGLMAPPPTVRQVAELVAERGWAE